MRTHDNAAQPTWDDHLRTLTDLALLDLRDDGEVRPTLIAFHGNRPLFLATLRPFSRGGHHDPIIEVGALATSLGANRLALSLSGRAWSTDDPIPPVLPGLGDLRQPVLIIHAVDAVRSPAEVTSTVWPIQRENDGDPTLGEAVPTPSAQGWVPAAMSVMAGLEDEADPQALLDQVVRCEHLGHQLAWGPSALRRVDRAVRRLGLGTPAGRTRNDRLDL